MGVSFQARPNHLTLRDEGQWLELNLRYLASDQFSREEDYLSRHRNGESQPLQGS
jgi:hypothetical protein